MFRGGLKMCFKQMEKNIKKMHWYDISLVKMSVLFFTLMIAKFWPGILGLEWYYYLILGVLFAIVPAGKVFKK